MARISLRCRRAAIVILAGSAILAPAAGAQSTDECIALNGVRYQTPDGASAAQYVGVEGSCRAAEGPEDEVEIEVIPVGGGGGGGDASGSGGDGQGGGQSPTGGSQGGTPPSGAGEGGGAGAPEAPATPREPANPPADRGTTPSASGEPDLSAEVVVRRTLSTTDDAEPSFVSVSGITSPEVGIPLLAGLALLGAGIGLRRKLT